MSRLAHLVSYLFSALSLCAGLSAQTVWTGATSSDWSDNSNWTLGVPSTVTDAVVQPATNAPSTAGSAFPSVRTLTVAAGANLTVAAAAPLDVFGSVTSFGSITGEMRLRGGGVIETGTTGSLDAIRVVTGTYTIVDATITSLFHDPAAGSLTVGAARILGNAIFRGGSLIGIPGSSLSCDGTALINTTSPTTTPPTSMQMRSTWTSDASWQPTSGKVTFQSPGSIAVNIAANTHWHDLEANSDLSVSSSLLVDGTLRMTNNVQVSGSTIDLGRRAGISAGISLGGANVTTLRIRAGLLAAGSITTPTATLDADGDITILASGSLTVGTGTHTVSDGLDIGGPFSVPAGSTLVFDGSSQVRLSAASLIPSVRVTGSNCTLRNILILGDLEQTAAAGNLSIQNCIVGGTCTLAGDSITNAGDGFLDAFGDLVLQTQDVVNTPPATISCSGSFTANANFQPTSGLVILDQPGLQSVTRAAFQWHDLRIANGTQIVTNLATNISGDLEILGELGSTGGTIDVLGAFAVPGVLATTTAPTITAHSGLVVGGTFFGTAARLIVNGDLTVTGLVSIGNGPHTLTGSLDVPGALQMPVNQTLVLDGSGTIDLHPDNILQNVELAGGNYDIDTLIANGNLLHQSGSITLQDVTIGGNATFQGAGLSAGSSSTLDVGGDVTMQLGSAVTNPPETIQCGGDWTSNSSFTPAAGLVEFDGSGPQVVSLAAFDWIDLRIGSGSVISTTLPVNVAGFLDLRGQLVTTGDRVNVQGDLSITASGILQANAATDVDVDGVSQIDGTLAAGAARLDAGGDITVASGGAVTLGNGPHRLQGGFAVLGSWQVPVTSNTLLQGSGQVNVTAGNPLGNVSFEGGDFTIGQIVALGDIVHTAGVLRIATMTGSSNASFRGASIEDFAGGFVEIAGNIDLTTSGVVSNPPSVIRCGGNWTSGTGFVPATGLVAMIGSGAQVMTSPQMRLANLQIANASDVSFGANTVEIAQDLSVAGTLAAPTRMSVGGDLQINGSGLLQLQPSGSASVSGSVTCVGAVAGGTLSLVGTGSIAGAGSLPDVSIAAVGSYLVTGTSVVSGDLTMTQGILQFEPSSNLQIAGNMDATGGTLAGPTTALLDIDGNASLDGLLADATGVPTIQIGGSLSASSAFVPPAGVINLDGVGTITAIGGPLAFADLAITGSYTIASPLAASAEDVTVAAGATLTVNGQQLDLTAQTLTIAGQLAIGDDGALLLGAQTAVTVTTSGSLAMVGSWDAPARVDGPSGGAYSFVIEGSFEASNYSFANMGPAGIEIRSGATLGSFPNDLRGGRFADGDAAAGSCLLQIDRPSALELRYVTFEDSGTVTFNVRSQGPGTVSFVNEGGNFASSLFEDDPSAVIDWLPAERTNVTSFAALGSLHQVNLEFATASEVDVQAFRLLRSDSATGPFVEVANLAPTGTTASGSNYGHTDTTAPDTIKHFYQLEEVLTHGEPRLLSEDFGRAWPDQVGNTTMVGPGGAYPDLATALAVTPAGGNIAVAAGTYAAIAIDKPVTIFPDGSGPVVIDTTLRSFTIENIPASADDMGIYDLVIGSGVSPFGMEVVNCSNVIVLDNLNASANGVPGLRVDGSTKIAVQNCELAGLPGLRFDNGSGAYLSRGTIDTLEVIGSSDITYCDVTPGATTVGIGSSADLRTGTMPSLQVDVGWISGKPVLFQIEADPNSFYITLFSFDRSYLDLSPVFALDMVLLLGQSAVTTLNAGLTGPGGTGTFSVTSPDSTEGLGRGLPLQVVGLGATGDGRFGTSRDIVFLP